MNSKIIIAIIVTLMSFTLSCFSDSKIVSKFISKNLRIKFYHSYPDREISPLLFAQVDSGKSRYTYYFKSNKIYKLDQNEKNYVYTLSFTVPDIQFSSNSYFSHISQLDLLVFKKANGILDSLKLNNKRPDGATGFLIEIKGH
jgi:hypothetical protein